MIQINLMPQRAKKGKVTVRQVFLAYMASVVIVIMLIGIVWIYQWTQIRDLQRRLAQVEEEVRQYAKYDVMLQEINKKKQIIDKKREIIRGLQQDRDTIVRLMALVSAEVPEEKIWLERLVQSGNSMTLDGVALSNESIAEFMRNLESSPYVIKGTVSLTHSRRTLISNMTLREFQIIYQYMPFSQVQSLRKAEGS
jgi:type IV pilus assembly protein PilN